MGTAYSTPIFSATTLLLCGCVTATAPVEYLGEDAGDVVGEAGDKSGNSGEVGLGVAGQGDEGDVVAADSLNVTAGNNALAVGKQNDLEEHGRRIGGSAGCVVVEAGNETGQV